MVIQPQLAEGQLNVPAVSHCQSLAAILGCVCRFIRQFVSRYSSRNAFRHPEPVIGQNNLWSPEAGELAKRIPDLPRARRIRSLGDPVERNKRFVSDSAFPKSLSAEKSSIDNLNSANASPMIKTLRAQSECAFPSHPHDDGGKRRLLGRVMEERGSTEPKDNRAWFSAGSRNHSSKTNGKQNQSNRISEPQSFEKSQSQSQPRSRIPTGKSR